MVNGAAYAPVLLYFYPNCSLSYKAEQNKATLYSKQSASR